MLIAFAITLRDRVAWILGGSALALAILLNSSALLFKSSNDQRS